MARGEQIYVYRPFMQLEGLYQHHGIDCGDDTVIHYRKYDDRARIERTSMESFCLGKSPRLCQYPPQEFCFIPADVIARAESRLGEEKYNLLFNNCEHFATWCKTGFSRSSQVHDWLPTLEHLSPNLFADPLRAAFKETSPQNAERLAQKALGDIKEVWDDLQPQYVAAKQEVDSWQATAHLALDRNREDLARAALYRKRPAQARLDRLQTQLDHLAQLTQNLALETREP
ncbi:MAG: lecithin retinol acyltransferase family protein [Cyanobacteria bacterium P01_H01_bin.15]